MVEGVAPSWSGVWRVVAPNVWYLGITSLLTDFSSEMVTSVLPVYLVLGLNLSPLAFGTLDGLQHGVTALTRWASGVAADRWRRHKEVAASGYALSAICRLALLAAGRSIPSLGLVIAVDRLGKGIRTAPRDALISLSSSPRHLAQSFGVHRTLDAAGAMLGPLAAFGLLALVPRGFDMVFVTSFCIAIVGVGVLLLLVESVPSARSAEITAPEPSFREGLALFKRHDFRVIVLAGSGLALLTISDAFIYLALQQRLRFSAAWFPLLYVGTALSFLLLAIPAGVMADRVGRPRVFLLGHAVLLLLYGLLVFPLRDPLAVVIPVILLGAYYAATDGVLAALASGILPVTLRGTGLAVLTTGTSLARFAASIAFGWLWTVGDRTMAAAWFGVALALGLTLATMALGQNTADNV